jgi:formyl-CoA transferase/CoA:oxalate CoA-transferase
MEAERDRPSRARQGGGRTGGSAAYSGAIDPIPNLERLNVESTGPLQGLRVIELAQNLAGPYCTHILAGLGADVLKVERPGAGDAARAWGPPFIAGNGSIFAAANRGKRSITLDIAGPEGQRALWQLLEDADILVEAFRPGAFARLGFGPADVMRANPRLLYCSVLAYGEEGPLAQLAGYDPLMQAHGGLMSITGQAGGPPARVGTSVVDMGTGMWLTIAILAALRQRDHSGRGSRISVALFDTAIAWNAYHLLGFLATGQLPGRMGTELPMIVPYGAFPCSDGEIMIAAANDGLFLRLCRALGLDAAVADSRFATNPRRVEQRAMLNEIVKGATARFTCDALLTHLRAAGVPCAPLLDVAAVAEDPQTLATGMISRMARDDGVDDFAVALPFRLDGARCPAGTPPPPLPG